MSECGLSNSDLAFYHEWPSIFNSGQEPKTQHIFFKPGHCPSDRDLNKSRRAFTPHWPASKHAIVNSTRKGRGKKGGQKKQARSVAAVGVLWFKWVHSLLDKQTDRSASVTGQTCRSVGCQLNRTLLTVSLVQDYGAKEWTLNLMNSINHFKGTLCTNQMLVLLACTRRPLSILELDTLWGYTYQPIPAKSHLALETWVICLWLFNSWRKVRHFLNNLCKIYLTLDCLGK